MADRDFACADKEVPAVDAMGFDRDRARRGIGSLRARRWNARLF